MRGFLQERSQLNAQRQAAAAGATAGAGAGEHGATTQGGDRRRHVNGMTEQANKSTQMELSISCNTPYTIRTFDSLVCHQVNKYTQRQLILSLCYRLRCEMKRSPMRLRTRKTAMVMSK